MNAGESIIETEAIDWLIRVNSPDFGDWDGLAAWMARSADHARAFNQLAALDDAFAAAEPKRQRNPLHATGDRDATVAAAPWRGLVGTRAFAAAVMTLVAFGSLFVFFPRTQVIETRPGEMREVILAEGVRAWLNGDTRIEYAGKDPKEVELVRGEALFDVTNGSARPFEVTAGRIVMRDLGTTFNVIHGSSVTELAVSSGRVIFDSKGAAITLGKGQAARVSGPGLGADRFTIPAEAIAGWRSGRLVYRNAALIQIAEDISRRTGVRIAVAPDAASLRFTGTIGLDKDLGDTLGRAGPILGVEAHQQGSGWVLDAVAP
jgi:transmembrane sensor